jgi:hypothetical protein
LPSSFPTVTGARTAGVAVRFYVAFQRFDRRTKRIGSSQGAARSPNRQQHHAILRLP